MAARLYIAVAITLRIILPLFLPKCHRVGWFLGSPEGEETGLDDETTDLAFPPTQPRYITTTLYIAAGIILSFFLTRPSRVLLDPNPALHALPISCLAEMRAQIAN